MSPNMNHDLLRTAVSCLDIREILLADSRIHMDPSVNPHDPFLTLRAEMSEGQQVMCEQVSGKTPEGKDCRFVRFGFQFNLTLLSPAPAPVDEPTVEGQAPKEEVKVTIEAMLKGVYEVMTDDFPAQEVTQAFIGNAKFHIWPYWREYVTHTISRMNLPTVTIPPYQIHHPNEDKDDVAEVK